MSLSAGLRTALRARSLAPVRAFHASARRREQFLDVDPEVPYLPNCSSLNVKVI
jgi:hypothetical protein